MKKIINLLNKIMYFFYKKDTSLCIPKKVLVVSNTALGDTILSTPVIKTLKNNFEDIHITFMVNKNVYPLFKDYEHVDKVITYNKKLIGIIKHAIYIKKNNYDSLFFLHSNGPQDLFIALASTAKNIHKAINYPNKPSIEFKNIIQNKVNEKKYQHIIEHRLDTIRYLKPNNIDTSIEIPKKFYNNKHIKHNNINIGIQLGAADTYKIWPMNNYIKLLNKLLAKYSNIEIYLLGIKSELTLANTVYNSSIHKEQINNLCGQTTIDKLPKIINSLDLLITNDTGTMHLAIALKKKTISLFSPTDYKIFGPYQDFNLHTIIQKDGEFINTLPKKSRNQDAMKLISIEEVYKAVENKICEINTCVE